MITCPTVSPYLLPFISGIDRTGNSVLENFRYMPSETGSHVQYNVFNAMLQVSETKVTSARVIERESRVCEAMLLAIDQAETEFSRANWNGEGALPVSRESLNTARNFVMALPEDFVEEPGISAFQDGTLSLTWEGEKSICTLSMEKDNWINYAMNDDSGVDYGKRRFENGIIPDRILDLIRRTIYDDVQ